MAELALAFVSLTFQVFSGCIKGYQLLSEASDMPKEYEHLRVRLKTEQFRLLDWARIVQVSEDDSSLIIGTAGRGMVHDVLHQQQELLFRFVDYNKNLVAIQGLDPPASQAQTSNAGTGPSGVRFPESEDLLQRALSYIHATRTLPKRLRWVAHQKPKMDILLGKITNLNNFLAELLDRNQAGKLVELQVRTNHEIMQLNSNFGQLFAILQAERSKVPIAVGNYGSMSHDTDNSRDKTAGELTHDNLASLAQTKAINLAIQEGKAIDPLTMNVMIDGANSAIASVELNREDFTLLDDISELGCAMEEPRTEAIFCPRKPPNSERRHVWVEWRHIPDCGIPGTPNKIPKMTSRLTALITMLNRDKNTDMFRAARCLGYFYIDVTTAGTRNGDEPCELWCGLVFEKPTGCDISTRPVSLLELLRAQQQQHHTGNNTSSTIPSLTQRVALALAVAVNLERLHAVNWLHKGLRSYNVLFFPDEQGNKEGLQDESSGSQDHDFGRIDFGQPILSGFDYSRPMGQGQWTEKAAQNPAHDIYRHPEVQADYCSTGDQAAFKKSYDYYSLGIVLLEIALWRPIDSVLNVDLEKARLQHTIKARKRLLNNEPRLLQDVRACMGDLMYSAIRACLMGPTAFGINEASNEGDPDTAVLLQREFYSQVVERLAKICI
ncbi:prion-inhibition and propagation-domain-containing protein [Xylaria sp. FL1777]|nr:prion-inhibition and propagation-domain-containing protein [Xylaria sp. FL1777]